jgi:hypothetical protein
MAVVQISRIQIRRGKKNSGTGLPQLASGELAWAIDSQELYIGNGAVSEGAPAVGNTKVLTTKDLASESNLFGLVRYTYKSNDPSIITGPSNTPISRTIQERLDDRVITTDFGTIGTYDPNNTDPQADDTSALQRAIDQLFDNASGTAAESVQARVILEVPPGNYLLKSTLHIPSFTTIIGAGAGKTVFYYDPDPVTTTITDGNTQVLSQNLYTVSATSEMEGAAISGTGIPEGTTVLSVITDIGGAYIGLRLSNDATANQSNATFVITYATSAIEFDSDTTGEIFVNTQPRSIQLSGLSIVSVSGRDTCLTLNSVRDSLFEDLALVGSWDLNYQPNTRSRGIDMGAYSGLVTTQNNIFRDITLDGFTYAIYAQQDIVNNLFESLYVTNSRQGVVFGLDSDGVSVNQITGPIQNQISKIKFDRIKQHAILIERGSSNTVSDCKLNNVGVNAALLGNLDVDAERYPQVYFGTRGNRIVNLQSDRSNGDQNTDLSTQAANFTVVPYTPEFAGHGHLQASSTTHIRTLGSTDLFRLPVACNVNGIPGGAVTYKINYSYFSDSAYVRSGYITVVADVDNAVLQVSDEYDTTSVPNGDAVTMRFLASFVAYDGSTWATGTPYGIMIGRSTDLSPDSGDLEYTYTSIQ